MSRSLVFLLSVLVVLSSCHEARYGREFNGRKQELTRARLRQLHHFMNLLKEENKLPRGLYQEELHQLIYHHFSLESHEFRQQIPYYVEHKGFVDAWGRRFRLMRSPGYLHYSWGADGLDHWGLEDDIVAEKTVVAP